MLNRTHRWNWGLIVEQTPYTIGQFSQGVTVDPNFGTAFVQQETRITQINRGITGITQYPVSRAQRVEFSGGIRRITTTKSSFFFGFPSGVFLGRTEEDLERPDALNLGETSAALVYDTSVFGATSPILGQRYRFDIANRRLIDVFGRARRLPQLTSWRGRSLLPCAACTTADMAATAKTRESPRSSSDMRI